MAPFLSDAVPPRGVVSTRLTSEFKDLELPATLVGRLRAAATKSLRRKTCDMCVFFPIFTGLSALGRGGGKWIAAFGEGRKL